MLGKTGMKVSVIGFGGMKLPDTEEQEAFRALNRALDMGINFVDTARNYGDSERKIGKALGRRRDEFFIATKVHLRGAQGAEESLKQSLDELGFKTIDLYQLHMVNTPKTYDQVMAPDGAYAVLEEAKAKGIINHIGISIHRDLSVMERAIRSGKFETIMLAYNSLDQEGVEPNILPLARQSGMGVIVMKGLAGGALVSTPEMRAGCERDPIVEGTLRYVLSNPSVSVVIPGIESEQEVVENAPVGDLPLPISEEEKDDLIRQIGALRTEFRYGQMCLRCGYCQPCPQDILIPEVFRAYDIYQNYPEDQRVMGVERYRNLEVTPDACVECRKCVEVCPAGLPIPERLREAMEAFAEA
jgi:predicted aldo/keto reductase-like oxidoreductase